MEGKIKGRRCLGRRRISWFRHLGNGFAQVPASYCRKLLQKNIEIRESCIRKPVQFERWLIHTITAVFDKYMMRKAIFVWDGGVGIGGDRISILRYADITPLAVSEYKMVKLELTINRNKIKLLIDKTTQNLYGRQMRIRSKNEFTQQRVVQIN